MKSGKKKVTDFSTRQDPMNTEAERNKPLWVPHSKNEQVGIDTTAMIINQHNIINSKAVKQRALLSKTKKTFAAEVGMEHIY